jgi:LacI family transcriptional regulator
LTNPFFPEIVQSFEDIAVAHGYEILLTSTVNDPRRMDLSVRRMVERCVDGIAVMTFGMEDLLLDNPRFHEIPLVFIDVGPQRAKVTNIRIDYLHGIRQAVQHLAALRHERIAFISGSSRFRSGMARRAAFEQSLKEIGAEADPELIVEGDHTVEGAMRCMKGLLGLKRRPTAVLCSNDLTALGVLQECYEERVRVPDSLSVVGHDDIRLARFFLPPLTTIRMSQIQLAKMAFHALLSEATRPTPSETGSEQVLQTNLILRKSTALLRCGQRGYTFSGGAGLRRRPAAPRRLASGQKDLDGPKKS